MTDQIDNLLYYISIQQERLEKAQALKKTIKWAKEKFEETKDPMFLRHYEEASRLIDGILKGKES